MSDNDRNLNFMQRYGHEDLPGPMKLNELSADFRRQLWNEIWRFLETDTLRRSYGRSGRGVYVQHRTLIKRVMGEFHRTPEDTVSIDREQTETFLRTMIEKADASIVLRLVEIFSNEPSVPNSVLKSIEALFDTHQAAYRLDLSEKPYRIFQRTSKEESDATMASLQKLQEHGFPGALSHLRQAAEHIHSQQFSDAIHDSISAVESVARAITSDADSLGKALKQLEDKGMIKHGAFKAAIGQLYGYTSDEAGIRHPLIKGAEADVGLPEALFFYSACAAFCGYLATIGYVR